MAAHCVILCVSCVIVSHHPVLHLVSLCAQVRSVSTSPANPLPEGASHFKRSAIKHPLADQLAMSQDKRDYLLPHPIWLDHRAVQASTCRTTVLSCTQVISSVYAQVYSSLSFPPPIPSSVSPCPGLKKRWRMWRSLITHQRTRLIK